MRYRERSLASQAWLLIPLALLIGGLVLYFGRGSDENQAVRVLESTASGMVLYIPPGRNAGQALTADDSGKANQAARKAAMVKLAEFRAHYQQLSLFVGVIATDDSAAGAAFAGELGDLLAQFNLGNRVKHTPILTDAGDGAPIVLRCGPGDVSVARDLLSALAPLLQGKATIAFDPGLGVADLLLAVSPAARHSGP